MKTVKSFATNYLVEGHDMYVNFMKQRFESLKKDGKESEVLFYKRGRNGKVGGDFKESQYRDIYKWHCITITYNIWSELVKDYVVQDKASILYKKHVDVPEDILKKFKYRVEQSIKNAKCDYNSRLPRTNLGKGSFNACRYLAMYWTYLDLAKDCKTQRYFPNGPTIVRAQRVFDYEKYTNPFFMNGKFSKAAIRDKKETKEVKSDTTNCVEIEDFDFSVRTYNILKRAHVNTLDDILKKTYDDLIKIRDMGKHSLNEITEKLRKFGYEYINADGLPQPIKYPRNVDGFDKNKLLIDIIEDRRLTNPLHRASIHTVGDFLSMSDKELLKIRTFGVAKLKAVREAIDKYAKQTKEVEEDKTSPKAVIDVAILNEYERKIDKAQIDYNALLEKFNNLKGDYDELDAIRDKLLRNNNDLREEIENLRDHMEELKNRETKLNIAANPKNLDTLALLNTVLEKMKDSKMEYILLTIDGMVIDIHPKQNFAIRTRGAGYGRV